MLIISKRVQNTAGSVRDSMHDMQLYSLSLDSTHMIWEHNTIKHFTVGCQTHEHDIDPKFFFHASFGGILPSNLILKHSFKAENCAEYYDN